MRSCGIYQEKAQMRKNIVIAAICLALLAGVYVAVSMIDVEQEIPEQTVTATDLLYFAEGEIKNVEITPRDEETMTLVAENMSSAKAVNSDLPLDTQSLLMAYASAVNPTYTKRFDGVEHLSDYGFDTPLATVKINESDGTYTAYSLGDKSVGGGYYLAFEGESTVYVTEEYMSYTANCTAESCADLALVPAVTDIAGFELESETLGRVVIEKGEKTDSALTYQDYVMTYPDSTLSLSEYYVNEYMLVFGKGVTAERMAKAHPESLAEYGLDKPYGSFELIADGVDYGFTLSQPTGEGKCYAVFNGIDAVYELNFNNYFKALTLTRTELCEQYLFIEKLDDFSKISFSGSGIDKTFKISGDMSGEDFAVTLNGEAFDASQFKTIYSSLIGIAVKGEVAENEKAGNTLLKVDMTYRDGREKSISYNYINVTKAAVSVDSSDGVYYVYTKDLDKLLELL